MRVLAAVLIAGCVDGTSPVATPTAAPCQGEGAWLRDEAAARGMTQRTFEPMDLGKERVGGHAPVVVADLDGDGDLDAITFATLDGLLAWENDGDGQFVAHTGLIPFDEQPVVGVAAVDLDGDRLPELVRSSWGELGVQRNLGGWRFAAPQWLVHAPGGTLIGTFHLVDLDGDGALDLVAPEQSPLGGDPAAARHRVFLQRDGWIPAADLAVGRPLDSQVVTAADCDRDGVMDVLLPGDQGDYSALLLGDDTADGEPSLADVAPQVGFDLDVAAMGIDGVDLNRDGVLDWVISDIGPPRLLVSQAGGRFAETGAAWGLVPAAPRPPVGTIGWTVDFADIDNDGDADLLQASARHDDPFDVPDLLFLNEGGRFVDASAAWGVGSEVGHYGLVAADFDGDGRLDVLSAGVGAPPSLLMNRCGGEQRWIELEFAGPRGNAEGWGVQVEVATAAGVQVQSLMNLRGQAQRPPRLHFGLADSAEPVRGAVYWPDGRVSLFEDLEPGQLHRLRLPAD